MLNVNGLNIPIKSDNIIIFKTKKTQLHTAYKKPSLNIKIHVKSKQMRKYTLYIHQWKENCIAPSKMAE